MTIRDGYRPHILRVDLNEETVVREPLPNESVLRRYVGGVGLGLYYLLKEAPPLAKATDDDMPLIFVLGPLTGTPAVNSGDWTVVSHHLMTPYSAAVGHSHGFWGAYLKHAGHEGIIFNGRASRPTYLWIDDDRVELRDASHLWGQDTRETERLIKLELGDEERISVACIGQAGEALLPGAMIKNDRNHGAGKGSLGAAMGSKNLKAVAVRGTGTVPLFDASGLVNTAMEWQSALFPEAAGDFSKKTIATVMQDAGNTRNYYATFGSSRRVLGKNATDPEWGAEFAKRYVAACERWKVVPKPSYNCLVACAYDVTVTDGPFAGFTGSKCGGAEAMEGSSSIIGVEEPGAVVALNDVYDSVGLEMGQFSPIMGAVYEAFNEGLINLEDTGGLDLTWGNWESAIELIEQTVRREGLGAKLALGIKALPEALGAEKGIVEEIRGKILDMKGGGAVMHDHRAYWGAFLDEVTAGYGASTQGRGIDTQTRPDLGYNEMQPGVAEDIEQALEKVEPVRRTQIAKLFWDSLGICVFGTSGVEGSMTFTSRSLAQAVGWEDFDEAEAMEVGERVASLLRLVYARRGFTKADELDVSPRFMEMTKVGAASEEGIAPYLPGMVDEYYRQMGWNVDTGVPTTETLTRLGMEEFVTDTA